MENNNESRLASDKQRKEAIKNRNSAEKSIVHTSKLNFTVGVYPNPFHEQANISFELETSAEVSLEVRDISGKLVQRLISNAPFSAGKHVQRFDGQDFSAGLYLYVLHVNGETITGKMVLRK